MLREEDRSRPSRKSVNLVAVVVIVCLCGVGVSFSFVCTYLQRWGTTKECIFRGNTKVMRRTNIITEAFEVAVTLNFFSRYQGPSHWAPARVRLLPSLYLPAQPWVIALRQERVNGVWFSLLCLRGAWGAWRGTDISGIWTWSITCV